MNTAELAWVTFNYPAIDNHAHPLLKVQHRDDFPFEGLLSEASPEAGLVQDAPNTLACYRATIQLAKLYKLTVEPSWEAIKEARKSVDYEHLCRVCMEPTKIQCIFLDDGLGGVQQYAEGYKWHDQFTKSSTKRIVRVEVLAEEILVDLLNDNIRTSSVDPTHCLSQFIERLTAALQQCASDPDVVGFKSIACYRTGLDISLDQNSHDCERTLMMILLRYEMTKTLRLADKPFNDLVVNTTLRIAGECGKPIQFHTGLGDNDINLTLSSPAAMQPIIKAYPQTKIVLLHSSYPYTRDAGYLTSVYPNVYLDFGEIFPFVSADGQRAVVKQMLELAPTNKIMWSTDGHWWPESYYLGTIQAREALYDILSACVNKQEMTESQAISIVKRALFENANRIYNLNLTPNFKEC